MALTGSNTLITDVKINVSRGLLRAKLKSVPAVSTSKLLRKLNLLTVGA